MNSPCLFRIEKVKTQTASSVHPDMVKKSSLKTKSSHPPKLSEWLRDSTAASKAHDKVSTVNLP